MVMVRLESSSSGIISFVSLVGRYKGLLGGSSPPYFGVTEQISMFPTTYLSNLNIPESGKGSVGGAMGGAKEPRKEMSERDVMAAMEKSV